jgi:hypothetical protein
MSAISPDTTKKDVPPAPPAPPADKPADKPAADGTKTTPWWDAVTASSSVYSFGLFVILFVVFIIMFHFGAAYLSYQKYGSILWSILDFFFAGFYYPFYAFFLAKDPGPYAGMMGGRRRKY